MTGGPMLHEKYGTPPDWDGVIVYPRDDLAPQDEVDFICWSLGITFDQALNLWCDRNHV